MMKKQIPSNKILTALLFLALSAFSCNDGVNSAGNIEELDDPTCYVHLFDNDDFKGDNIILGGPAEFASLHGLPGANKNWHDEADSFKSGENTVAVFWKLSNFEGDSTVFEKGAAIRSIEEPGSIKIQCN